MRWSRFIDGNANGGLNLESLLRAQERVTEAEREYVNTLLIYNLAVINLKRANGTLLISENVTIDRECDPDCGPSLELNKSGPASDSISTVNQPALAPEQAIQGQQFLVPDPQILPRVINPQPISSEILQPLQPAPSLSLIHI